MGNLTDVTNVRLVTSVSDQCFTTVSPHLSLFFLLGRGFTLKPKSVFLCSEVCVLLVPFVWGQALFSVEVLRVYPNVQDLGVSARLSESGGNRGEETFY